MVQTSVQFTPVQVLQAARRAEAEGKMDYALQFYRHLVEQHGGTPEAQEAREGLFRIAEWRWGEARVARSRDGATNPNLAAPGQVTPNTAPNAGPADIPPAPPTSSGQRVYNVANNPPQSYPADQQLAAHPTSSLPQVLSRRQSSLGEELPAFHPRFRAAKVFAHALAGFGWLTALAGLWAAVAGFGGLVGELSAIALLGAPFGVMLGLPAVVFGLLLIVGGQVAAALFDSVNATLELTAIERGRASF